MDIQQPQLAHYATGNQRQVKFMREGSLFPGWKPVFTTERVDGGACSQFTVVTASSLHPILIKIESLSTINSENM